jgi:crotonobetainyl-CoA:carnitine CoA-transferase CaiB-like acyl-CoA transferase
MAAKADVWLENLAPGVLERMGLGYAALKTVNPRIVYCSVSGYGIKSNYGDKKAFDSVVQAASGVMYMTGYADHLPVKIGISASDLAVGVGLVGAVLAALRYRDLSGKGTHVDLAMADIGVWMTQATWPEVFFGGGHPMRMGNRSATACPHNIFQAQDAFLAIAVDNNEQWQQLARLSGIADFQDAELATLEGRLRHMDRIETALSAWVAPQKAEELAAACQSAGVPAAPVRDMGGIVKDADVARRKLIIEVEHPVAGKMKLLGNPLKLSRTPAEVSDCAPVLGRHSREVLREWLDTPAQRIDALAEAGIVVINEDGQSAPAKSQAAAS